LTITKERLTLVIELYENEVINPDISDINTSFTIQLIYATILFICFCVANADPSLNTILGTLGLGGLSIKGGYEDFQNSFQEYLNDRRIHKRKRAYLRLRLELCDPDNVPCLEELEADLREIVKVAGADLVTATDAKYLA